MQIELNSYLETVEKFEYSHAPAVVMLLVNFKLVFQAAEEDLRLV